MWGWVAPEKLDPRPTNNLRLDDRDVRINFVYLLNKCTIHYFNQTQSFEKICKFNKFYFLMSITVCYASLHSVYLSYENKRERLRFTCSRANTECSPV